MKKEDLVLPPEVSYTLLKLNNGKLIKDIDISELLGMGFQEQVSIDEWLDLINEGKKVEPKLRVQLHPEMVITIKTIQSLTGYDYWQVFYYGISNIVYKLIETGKITDLEQFGEQREMIRKTLLSK